MSVEDTRTAPERTHAPERPGTTESTGISGMRPATEATGAEQAVQAGHTETAGDPVDLGGGCGGECAGCGVAPGQEDQEGRAGTAAGRPTAGSGPRSGQAGARSAVAVGTDGDAGSAAAPSAVRLARLGFVLGVLVGVGLTALVGAVLPEAMPFLAAAALVIVAAAGIVAVLRGRPGAGR